MEQFNSCESKHMDIIGFAAAVGSATLELGGAKAVTFAKKKLAERAHVINYSLPENGSARQTDSVDSTIINQIDGMNIYE